MERYTPRDPLQLIRKRALAKLLNVNPWTLDNWRRSGRIPEPITLSEHVIVWRRADIERWLHDRETQKHTNKSPRQNRTDGGEEGGNATKKHATHRKVAQ